ncbi:MAG: acyl-CoA synthetase [Bacillota bacterium]|nr:MAG: acyl-CoA synthetase [Bacillota bacterium]
MEDRPWYAHWPKGLQVSLDYPDVAVPKFLESAAYRHPDRTAVVFQIGEGTMTYTELHEKARRFAAALAGLGVRKGEVVTLHLPNCPQFIIAYYGLLMIGATFSPCFPLLGVNELRHQLVDSGARTIVTFDMFAPTIQSIRHDTDLKRVIITGIQENLPPYTPVDVKPYGGKTWSFQALLDETKSEPPEVKIDPAKDLAHLAYTGGTTGLSKGVMLTHRAVVVNTMQFAHWAGSGRPILGDDGYLDSADRYEPGPGEPWEYPTKTGETTVVIVVPWSHAMGSIGYLNNPVYGAATMIVHPRFDPAAYANDIPKHKATAWGGAPQVLQGVAGVEGIESLDFSSVKYISSGAAPLPVELLRRVRELVPDAVVMEGYGMTEMTMGAVANPANRSGLRKPGSVGIPVFDTDVKIVDLDDPDIEIGFNELGEVCLRGPQMMLGYWKRPEETATVIRDGWVHSGDIGRLDEDGYLYIVDRKKDMLIYNGFNVYPRELEEILRSHRVVADCVVVGKPHPRFGEYPKAFVVLRPDKTATAEELMAFVAGRVAPYKKIRELEFISEIPMSHAGKPLRRQLREWEVERSRAGAEAGAAADIKEEPSEEVPV